MVDLYRLVCTLLLFWAALSVSSGHTQNKSRCTPHFDASELLWQGDSLGTWISGNSAHSIVREDGSTLWLFGSTLVNAPSNYTENGATLIPNSVGVSRCDEVSGEFKIRYDWGISERLHYEAIFKPHNLPPRYSYRPGQPWMYHGFLFVPLQVVELKVGIGDGVIVGTHLARVLNPEENPSDWRITYGPLFPCHGNLLEQGIINQGRYIYFINTTLQGSTLSRILQSDVMGSLLSLAERVEFYANTGEWARKADNTSHKVVSVGVAHDLVRNS